MKHSQINLQPEIFKQILKDDGTFPNSNLFLLIYTRAFEVFGKEDAEFIQSVFESNNWKNSWKDGIYNYTHYHSNTHEVLGISNGSATVQFGGPSGIKKFLQTGDVVIIPAGVAHKCISCSDDFECIGAYPNGMNYDIKRGITSERPKADDNIKNTPLPDSDPVYGNGPLQLYWEMQ